MERSLRLFLTGSLCLMAFACIKPVYYEKYQTIDTPWDKNTSYFFTCEMEDLSASYNLSVQIRNNNLYPFQNLWLFFAQEQPNGTIVRDTVECILADGYGKWTGSGISVYHLTIPIRSNYNFPQKGSYIFTIRQGMRVDQLKGIQQLGLRIEKNN